AQRGGDFLGRFSIQGDRLKKRRALLDGKGEPVVEVVSLLQSGQAAKRWDLSLRDDQIYEKREDCEKADIQGPRRHRSCQCRPFGNRCIIQKSTGSGESFALHGLPSI